MYYKGRADALDLPKSESSLNRMQRGYVWRGIGYADCQSYWSFFFYFQPKLPAKVDDKVVHEDNEWGISLVEDQGDCESAELGAPKCDQAAAHLVEGVKVNSAKGICRCAVSARLCVPIALTVSIWCQAKGAARFCRTGGRWRWWPVPRGAHGSDETNLMIQGKNMIFQPPVEWKCRQLA